MTTIYGFATYVEAKGYVMVDFYASRFKSPEEYQLIAEITSATNVYTLAGLAFAFIGGRSDKSYEKWEANRTLYNICVKALENKPENRFKTISAFYREWNEANKSQTISIIKNWHFCIHYTAHLILKCH